MSVKVVFTYGLISMIGVHDVEKKKTLTDTLMSPIQERSKMNMIDYAKTFIGTKYKWGGESAEEGFDCSGFVQEVLSSQGLDPIGDQTAHMLMKHFLKNNLVKSAGIKKNSLLFFGSGGIASHVAIAINDFQMIEAGGEGRVETSKGMVRIRPIKNRNDLMYAMILDLPSENKKS